MTVVNWIHRLFCCHHWQNITCEIVPQTEWERPKDSCLPSRPFRIVRTKNGFQRRQFYDVQECVYCGKRQQFMRWSDNWTRIETR